MESNLIGIRAENKNEWERRAPLAPDHVAELVQERQLRILVQRSPLRVFEDSSYQRAGAEVVEELTPCKVIFGVKEIPEALLEPEKAYLYFSHTIKGQASNMPALRKLLELRCTLIDYEPIVDRRGRRVVFFGRHAGYAGMIDTLHALGKRLELEGFSTPLAEIRKAHEYASLTEAMDHVTEIGERFRQGRFLRGLRPIVVGFAGSGNVSQGAQTIFECLPFEDVELGDLLALAEDRDRPKNLFFRVSFAREDRVRRITDGGYDGREFASDPSLYESAIGPYLPHLTVLVNGTYWDPRQPPLLTRAQLQALWTLEPQPKLRVIGDITCDINGGVESTIESTEPGSPCYVFDPFEGSITPGFEGRGPVVMAVDNLPCEISREATEHFGDSLLRFVPALARCDWSKPLEELELPEELRRAVVVHKGQLAPRYAYLERFME